MIATDRGGASPLFRRVGPRENLAAAVLPAGRLLRLSAVPAEVRAVIVPAAVLPAVLRGSLPFRRNFLSVLLIPAVRPSRTAANVVIQP